MLIALLLLPLALNNVLKQSVASMASMSANSASKSVMEGLGATAAAVLNTDSAVLATAAAGWGSVLGPALVVDGRSSRRSATIPSLSECASADAERLLCLLCFLRFCLPFLLCKEKSGQT